MSSRWVAVLFLFSLAVLAAVPAGARAGKGHAFELRDYEVSFSGAYYPGRAAFGYGDVDIFPGSGIADIYQKAAYYDKGIMSGSWTFAFTYNFTKIWALQAGLSYEGEWRRTFRRADVPWFAGESRSRDTHVGTSADNYISALASVRVSWLNRRIVRMYSSVGLGISMSVSRPGPLEENAERRIEYGILPAFQVCALGISVGKQLFGFAELGIGEIYVGGCLGIGYRF